MGEVHGQGFQHRFPATVGSGGGELVTQLATMPILDVRRALERIEIALIVTAFSGGTLDLGSLIRFYADNDPATLMASPAVGTNLIAVGSKIMILGKPAGALIGGAIGSQLVHKPSWMKVDLTLNTGTATSITGLVVISIR